MNNDFDIESYVLGHIHAHTKSMYTTLPGQIVRVYSADDSDATLVSVQLGVAHVTTDKIAYADPVLDDIPLVWPGSDGCAITCTIGEGDSVLVHFAMRNCDRFKYAGDSEGINSVIIPVMRRSHDINDAFAVPSRLFFKEAPSVDQNAVRISSGETEIRVMKDGTIEFGEGATERLIKGDLFKSFLDPILSAIKTHVHPDPVSGTTAVSAELATMEVAVPESNLSEVTKTK